MAQTTGAISPAFYDIEASANGSSWIDIGGTSNKISGLEQARKTGEAYTASGDTAIITGGKREPMELEFSILYTEVAGEGFETVRALFEASKGDPIWVRWAPKGKGAVGNFVWNVIQAEISNFNYGELDAGEASPIMAGFSVKVAQIVKTTAATSTGMGS